MNFAKETQAFAELLATSVRHRKDHNCGAYPYQDGSLLQVLAATVAPIRVVEVGTAIGYTSICMASAAARALIDTVDMDPVHVELARENFEKFDVGDRVTAHCGDADHVLPTLGEMTYDLAFFDGFAPTASILAKLHRLLRQDGLLICANLTLGGDGGQALADPNVWLTHSLGETALAVKR